jgi:acetylornithine deacetylase/succinyl-diaminopimelate desuccinylase-like protein
MWSAMTLLAVPAIAQNSSADHQRLGREVLKELIETNTTHSSGSVTAAAERMAARLVSAGFPQADVQVVGGAEKKRNLVARYRGNGAREPILFIAHLDVVEARREDWSFDPFVLTEQDGYFYGRGTLDVKGGAATLVAAFLRLRQERWVPDRDLILALTADEEGGSDNGVSWLLANRRDLVEAEYCINVDTGGGELRGGTLTALDVQAAEKVYASFTLTVKNAGGHSSLPTKDNAIYRLAAGLRRLAAFEFPARLNDTTRAYFGRMADAPSARASAADMRAVSKEAPSPAAAARLSFQQRRRWRSEAMAAHAEVHRERPSRLRNGDSRREQRLQDPGLARRLGPVSRSPARAEQGRCRACGRIPICFGVDGTPCRAS